jgi:hypothetical protein
MAPTQKGKPPPRRRDPNLVSERTQIRPCVPTGPETKNDCAGECQQQFTGLDWTAVESVSSSTVNSHYLVTTSEQTEDFMCDVVVAIYSV